MLIILSQNSSSGEGLISRLLVVGSGPTLYQDIWGQLHRDKLMKCDLNIWIARSSALRLCKCGGNNWYWFLCLSKPCLSMDDASLSRMYVFG